MDSTFWITWRSHLWKANAAAWLDTLGPLEMPRQGGPAGLHETDPRWPISGKGTGENKAERDSAIRPRISAAE